MLASIHVFLCHFAHDRDEVYFNIGTHVKADSHSVPSVMLAYCIKPGHCPDDNNSNLFPLQCVWVTGPLLPLDLCNNVLSA